MALDKRTREQMLAHCGDIHDDDGVAPSEFFKADRAYTKEDRKSKQLCRQVAETLEQVFLGELGDDALRELCVASVVPAPDSSRLLVTLYTHCEPENFDRGLVEERLNACKGYLRCEVASSITRRKTPVLVFNVICLGSNYHANNSEDSQ